jgi:flagellin
MPIGILNNIPSLAAENELTLTSNALNSTLEQLSSGQRINSGADDPAGLSIANGLQANIAALSQSVSNANDGVGELQLADGALAQVTTLLDTAVTLATESATGTVSNSQRTAIQAQYASILSEINRIGTATTYNGQAVFQGGTSTNLNAVSNPTVSNLTLNTALTVGDTTSVSAGGQTFTYTAANGTATTTNANQVGSSLTTTAAGAATLAGGTITINAGGKSQTFTGGSGTGQFATVATLLTAINANTDSTGVQAFQNSAGNVEIVDPNNNGDLTVTTTGTGTNGIAAVLGTFSNPTVNVTNPNEDVGSVTGLTSASVLAVGDAVTLNVGGHNSTYTVTTTASTVGALITALNTGATSGSVVFAGTAGPVDAFLNSAGAIEIVDPGNNNDLNVTSSGGSSAAQIGNFTAAPQVVAPTVQDLINAINSNTTVGAKAQLVSGQLVITDPQDRGDLAVTTNDNTLGAPVSGAPTSFVNQTSTSTADDPNQLVGSVTSLTLTSALTSGDVTAFTVGGKSFSFTAGASSTVGSLINAINTPSLDPAGLTAYLNSAGSLVVTDPNNDGNIAVSSTNTETVLGTYSNPTLTSSAATNIFLSDSTAIGSSQIAVTIGGLSTSSITNGTGTNAINLAITDLNTQSDAQTALTQINQAVANIASTRGTLGASVNRLTSASNVINSQVQNLTSAENTILAADIPTDVANLTKFSILEQTGISALAQANQQQQLVLKLLQ